MKPEYEKSTKARFLAEYRRHIEQMIQTINRAPIYSEIIIGLYFQIRQASYELNCPTERVTNDLVSKCRRTKSLLAEFIMSDSTDNWAGVWIPNLSIHISKKGLRV